MGSQVKWENLLSYDTLVHAIAGSVGSMTAMTTFYPLDTVRSRLQVEDNRDAKNTWVILEDLVKEEGFESLYRGLGPVLTSLCCSNFIYFYTFHGLRSIYVRDPKSHNALKDLAIASVAGAINVLATTPLWVVNTRLRLQDCNVQMKNKKTSNYPHYEGIIDGLYKIKKLEGWKGIWGGLVPSLMLVSNPALQFMIYEALKREALKAAQSKALNSSNYFIIGAIAKCISTVLTYPLQLVQSKLRYGSEELKRMNILYVLIYIMRKNGFKELYKGMEAKLLQTVMTTALMFLCYEKIVALVFSLLKRNRSLSH